MIHRAPVALFVVSLLSVGCASFHYQQTKPGTLAGKLLVQWIDHDKFIFIPDQARPLSFTRHNRKTITPGRMYTDGGSIPRPLWALRSYSPWGYAPAFIVHDWLFRMKQCKIPGHEEYTVEEAAWVMSEVMKTMMEQHANGDRLAHYAMYEAVRSPIAVSLWENGKCEQPTPEESARAPKMEYVIEFK